MCIQAKNASLPLLYLKMVYYGYYMLSKNTKFYSVIVITADFLVLLIAFTVAYILRVQVDHRPLVNPVLSFDYAAMALTILPAWIIVFASLGLYNSRVYNRRLAEWGRVAIGVLVGILIIIGWEYSTGKVFFPARLVAAYALIISFVAVIVERELLRAMRSLAFRYGIGISRVLIIGKSEATATIAQSLSTTGRSGYLIVAMATPKRFVPYRRGIVHYDDIEMALKNIKAQRIDTIIQTDLSGYDDMSKKILSAAQVNHVRYNFIPGEPEFYTGKNTIDVFLGYPMISVSQTPLIGWGAIVKRIFDVFLVVLTLPIWGSLLALTWLLQKIFNPGPALYNSTRLSQFSRQVTLYKFRSMAPQYGSKDAAIEFEEMGRPDLAKEYRKYHKVVHDPRITRFGKLLRATSLDELPQIINVLRGDISLVGPRPILPQEVNFSPNKTALLHSVQSGLTGLWQVSGRSNLSFEERIELETFYAQNWSFLLDLKILFKTVKVVLFKIGAR